MKPSKEELFKQALLEGVNRHFNKILDYSDEEIQPSKEHMQIMKSIISGTYNGKDERKNN